MNTAAADPAFHPAPARPTAPPSELSRPYWEAAAQGRLVIQACAACGTLRHYPRLLCNRCHSDACTWQPASGEGLVHSWTVSHHAFHPSFAAELPYTLVTVDLIEGVRALGRYWGQATLASPLAIPLATPLATPLAIGLPVQGRFEPREGGVDLVFRPRQG